MFCIISLCPVPGSFFQGSHTFAHATWFLTSLLRGKAESRIAPLARLLLTLINKEEVTSGVAPEILAAAVQGIQQLPHSREVVFSLKTLAHMIKTEDLDAIASFQLIAGELHDLEKPMLRPQVVEALLSLRDIAVEVACFQQASSTATQSSAINRSVGMLNDLAKYVESINLPERTLLKLTVERWQRQVAEAAGRLGEQALREITPLERLTLPVGERQSMLWSRPAEPFPNPYKTGDPVIPPLFVGRQEIFAKIREIWNDKENLDSVILYGHRRMGKSSILRNLNEYVPIGSLLVVADLRGDTAFVEHTGQLFFRLSERVFRAARKQGLEIAKPTVENYSNYAEASHKFHHLLWDVLDVLPASGSLILALDEFEALDKAVKDAKVGVQIYDYLRALSQEPRIALVFAGLHALDEMTRIYGQAFFDSYVNLRVSYLNREDARRLIARPTPDFRLNYHSDVIAEIIRETYGQPLMIQRICQELVHHLNHELFDLQKEREVRILPSDLNAVLNDEFVRNETRYFSGIWEDQVVGRAGAESVMTLLAEAGPLQAPDLAGRIGLSGITVEEVLHYLEMRDMVYQQDGTWGLCIPLMRRWLRLREGNGGR